LLDEVAFAEERLLQLAGHLRSHRDHRGRFDVANRGDVDRHVLLGDLGRDDRRHAAVAAATASASSSAAARTWPGRGGAAGTRTGRHRGGKREDSHTVLEHKAAPSEVDRSSTPAY